MTPRKRTAASDGDRPPTARPLTDRATRKASPLERAAAERLEPLARAAFWARESNLDPTDAVAGTHLANALRVLGQYDEAGASAQRVLVLDPNNYDALLESARAHVAQGQGFYAIEPAKHAQALAPKDWRPLSLLGVAYTQVRREDDAKAAWQAALALSPENPAVLSNMAMELAANGDAPGAEVLLRRAAAQPTASLQVRQDLTLVLGMEGKLGEAEERLRQDLPPDEADADLAYLKTFTVATIRSSGRASPRSWATRSRARAGLIRFPGGERRRRHPRPTGGRRRWRGSAPMLRFVRDAS